MISTVNHYSAYNYFSPEAHVTQSRANVDHTSGLTGRRCGYFGSTALLCWRNDAVYTGLRSHLMLAVSAYHFCWRASRNHCRLAFVGFDGDRLSKAIRGSWEAHVLRAQTPRDAYPRLSGLSHKFRGPNRDEPAYAAADGPRLRQRRCLRQGSGLARYLRRARATRARVLCGLHDEFTPSLNPTSRASHRYVRLHRVADARSDHDEPGTTHALRHAVNLVRSSWSSTTATPGGYYSNPNARVRNGANAYGGLRRPSPSRTSRTNPLRPDYASSFGPRLGIGRREFGPNVGRLNLVASPYEFGGLDASVTTTIGHALARADGSAQNGPNAGVQVAGLTERNHAGRISTSELPANPSRLGVHWIKAHGSYSRAQPIGGDGKATRKTQPLPGSTFYGAGLGATTNAFYGRFVVNPNLSQADLVIFANPTLTPSLVKQARQLGLPTLGLHSALRSGTDMRRRNGNPGLSFGILGNPNNPWLSFNLGASLLKLNRRASANQVSRSPALAPRGYRPLT